MKFLVMPSAENISENNEVAVCYVNNDYNNKSERKLEKN